MTNQGFQSDVKYQYPPQAVGQPYPPQNYGQPQPGNFYSISPPYNPGAQPYPPQHQQQQQVVVVGAQPQGPTTFVVAQAPPYVAMTGAIVLSCIVFWCCGMLFGGIAFILAIIGQGSAAEGNTRSAIQLRNASYGLSIAGIVIGVIIIAVVAGVVGSAASAVSRNCYYNGVKYYC